MGLLLLHRHCTGNRMDFFGDLCYQTLIETTLLISFDHPVISVDMRILSTESGIWNLVLDQKKSPDFITGLTV